MRRKKLNSILISLSLVLLVSSLLWAGNFRSHLEKGKNYSENYYHKETLALKEFQSAYKIAPQNFEVIYWLGRSYYDNRKYEEALPLLEEAVKISPNHLQAQAHLAYTLGRIGENKGLSQAVYKARALRHLSIAKRLNPKLSDIYHAYGVGWHYLKLYGKAEEDFKEGIRVCPPDPWLYAQLGRTYLITKRYNEAEEVFKKAMQIVFSRKPKAGMREDNVPRGIALFYEEVGMWDKALSYAQRALSLNPKDLCLCPEFSIKRLIKRIKEEKRLGKPIPHQVSAEI